MSLIKISLDETPYTYKPSRNEVGAISNRIYKNPIELSIDAIADLVGNKGCSFAPAVFDGKERKTENAKEIQFEQTEVRKVNVKPRE